MLSAECCSHYSVSSAVYIGNCTLMIVHCTWLDEDCTMYTVKHAQFPVRKLKASMSSEGLDYGVGGFPNILGLNTFKIYSGRVNWYSAVVECSGRVHF